MPPQNPNCYNLDILDAIRQAHSAQNFCFKHKCNTGLFNISEVNTDAWLSN